VQKNVHHKKKQKKKLEKQQVWNNDISNAYKEMKQTNINWCNAGKPKGNHPLVEHRSGSNIGTARFEKMFSKTVYDILLSTHYFIVNMQILYTTTD
jgi:hypothetical protein